MSVVEQIKNADVSVTTVYLTKEQLIEVIDMFIDQMGIISSYQLNSLYTSMQKARLSGSYRLYDQLCEQMTVCGRSVKLLKANSIVIN